MMKAFYPNWKNFSKLLFVFVLTLLLFSCSETPEPDKPQLQNPPPKEDPKEDPDNDPKEVPTTYEQIEGKWLIGEVPFANSRQANARISTRGKTGIGSRLYGSKTRIGENFRVAEEEDYPAFIEFLADSTYLFFEGGWGELFRGKVIASGSNTLELKGFGTIEDFDFSEGKFVFKLTPDKDSSVIPVEATKVPPLELDERTKLLSRDWDIEESWGFDDDYCDFECLIGKEIYEYDPWGDIIGTIGILERYVLVFTPSGTVFFYGVISGKFFTEDPPFSWSWPNDGANEITIRGQITVSIELTSDKLTIIETDDEGEYGMVFKAGLPYFED